MVGVSPSSTAVLAQPRHYRTILDEGRLADLQNTLRLIGLDAAEYAPLLAPLVDIPLPEDRRVKFTPEELRRRQLAAMTAWVLAGARSQPAVIVFEDLHWADPREVVARSWP